jgi:hypothetical protein
MPCAWTYGSLDVMAFRGSNVTAIGRLLGASAAAAVLVLGVAAYAQTTELAKKPAKTKSVCNSLTEETACKANDTCRWIGASTDAKTGKQKRKAYCRTQAKSTKKKSTEPAKK